MLVEISDATIESVKKYGELDNKHSDNPADPKAWNEVKMQAVFAVCRVLDDLQHFEKLNTIGNKE